MNVDTLITLDLWLIFMCINFHSWYRSTDINLWLTSVFWPVCKFYKCQNFTKIERNTTFISALREQSYALQNCKAQDGGATVFDFHKKAWPKQWNVAWPTHRGPPPSFWQVRSSHWAPLPPLVSSTGTFCPLTFLGLPALETLVNRVILWRNSLAFLKWLSPIISHLPKSPSSWVALRIAKSPSYWVGR